MTAEHQRLESARRASTPWKKWGPYLSEQQWGSVSEGYGKLAAVGDAQKPKSDELSAVVMSGPR
jgi:hypothetical protein